MSLCLVRLIETVFRSIEYCESGFLKNETLLFQKHIFKSFSSFLSLSLWFRLGSTSDFCHFWSFFLQGFSLQTPVRPFYPSFCFYFHISCILFWEFRTYTIFGDFDASSRILCNWSMGFVDMLLYSWSLLENLINLEICEKSKFLGLVLNSIWGFCSIWFNLMKLACWIDVIDHYFV